MRVRNHFDVPIVTNPSVKMETCKNIFVFIPVTNLLRVIFVVENLRHHHNTGSIQNDIKGRSLGHVSSVQKPSFTRNPGLLIYVGTEGIVPLFVNLTFVKNLLQNYGR